jgi:sirohydrochlorin cobaltochelatase
MTPRPPIFDREFGLLVVGHGTHHARGQREFETLVARLGDELSGLVIEAGFIELMRPTIGEAVDRLVERGARRIRALPLLLFAAGHAQHDIPAALRQAGERHPGLEIEQADVLGCHPALVELAVRRAAEVLPAGDPRWAETLLLMVGRGSHEATATAEMGRFARLRSAAQQAAWGTAPGAVETCFLAMAEPRLAEAVRSAAVGPWRRIMVQPHLLFAGELLETVRAQVAEAQTAWPAKLWMVADHLGPDSLVVEAAVSRAGLQLESQDGALCGLQTTGGVLGTERSGATGSVATGSVPTATVSDLASGAANR